MERIQTAIEKARARREREMLVLEPALSTETAQTAASVEHIPLQPVAVPTAVPDPTDAPAPKTSAEPLSEQARKAAWSRLKPVIPNPSHLQRNRILTLQGGRDAVLFDQIRTKVLQTMRANKWTRLAITSPSPGCGKSTLALNLGFSLARQPDLFTILLELDLRRPSLTSLLGKPVEKGIVPWLEGRITFADQALCYNDNFALSLCGQPMREASELMLQSRTASALSQLEAEYNPDLMIFDMPPMQASDDMMAFASQVDCVLIVAAAENTTVKQIDTCERDLAAQTNAMGVVLNKCEHLDPETGYGYYYS